MSLFGKLFAAAAALSPRSSVATTSSDAFKLPEAMRALGIELIATTGEQAFSEWQRLKAEGRKSPVIVGDDEDLEQLLDLLSYDDPKNAPSQILQRAAALVFPESLRARRAEDERAAAEWMAKQSASEEYFGAQEEPEVGEWPDEAVSSPTLTIVFDDENQYKPKVHILLLPTLDDTEIPAYLSLGGWNECPAAEYHVAALRSWKTRFGATIVAVNSDTINMIVTRRPADREMALAVAREQFLYCEDIVTQGTETLAPLAAGLMTSRWWFFWWD